MSGRYSIDPDFNQYWHGAHDLNPLPEVAGNFVDVIAVWTSAESFKPDEHHLSAVRVYRDGAAFAVGGFRVNIIWWRYLSTIGVRCYG